MLLPAKLISSLRIRTCRVRNFASCLAALVLSSSHPVDALTVSATTSDNGYPAHLIQWVDTGNNPRSAVLVDQNATGAVRYFYDFASGKVISK